MKLSILLMYRRIFSVDTLFRLHVLLLGVFVLAFWFAASIARLFFCRPFGYFWKGIDLEKHCFGYNGFWLAVGLIEVAIDIFILALPVRMVLRIQFSNKQKASVMFVFLLGSLYGFPRSSS